MEPEAINNELGSRMAQKDWSIRKAEVLHPQQQICPKIRTHLYFYSWHIFLVRQATESNKEKVLKKKAMNRSSLFVRARFNISILFFFRLFYFVLFIYLIILTTLVITFPADGFMIYLICT